MKGRSTGGEMIGLLARRMAATLLIVALVGGMTAALLHILPGDTAGLISEAPGRLARPDSTRAGAVLDWFSGLVHLDFGQSLEYNRPTLELIAERLPRTLVLTLSAAVFQLVLGIAGGIFLALRRGRLSDYLSTSALMALDAAPSFWLGIVLIVTFSVELGWLPPGGVRASAFSHESLPSMLADRGAHLVLPLIALGSGGAAAIARIVRSGMIDALSSVQADRARAHGLRSQVVVTRYAMRTALLPLITIVGMSLPNIVGGAVVVEHVFNWQGMGMLATGAVLNRDVPVVLTTTLLFAVLVGVGNLLADLVHVMADPRVRGVVR